VSAPARPIPLAAALVAMVTAIAAAILVSAAAAALELGWIARVSLVQILCFAAPALLVATATATAGSALGGLGVVRPRVASLAGAALLGATFWYLSAVLVAPWFARWQTEADTNLAATLIGEDPLLVRLLVLAVLPGLCEELLVRGAILRGLAPRLGAAGAIAASSVYFAVLHLSPARAVPTALLGAILAVMALRSGSLGPPVLAHMLNNAAVVLLADPELGGLAAPLLARPAWFLPVAAAGSAGGLALLWRAGAPR
jgi:membrane protease YdiL (CAAX protease family)